MSSGKPIILFAVCLACCGCFTQETADLKAASANIKDTGKELREAAKNFDPAALNKLVEQIELARRHIEKQNRELQGLELERADRVPKEIIGNYKNVHGKSTKVMHISGADFKFTGEASSYTYRFDPKKVVFVCVEIEGAEAYYFPKTGVLAFSGYDGEALTFWRK